MTGRSRGGLQSDRGKSWDCKPPPKGPSIFHTNDRFLASVSLDKTAHLWNLDTNLPVGLPLQHQYWVEDAALSADGKFLVTACGDNAYVWNTHTILQEAHLQVAHVKSILNVRAMLLIVPLF